MFGIINYRRKNMIIINLRAPLKLTPALLRKMKKIVFRRFLKIFINVRSVSPLTTDLSGSGARRPTIFFYFLEACIIIALVVLQGLRDFFQPQMNGIGIIFFVTSAKNLRILKFEQEKHLEKSCLRLFLCKIFILFRVKLQTSLYHPIPLDSKPYKQTNMLENVHLISAVSFVYLSLLII